MSIHGSSAMTELGIQGNPIGTPEEIRKVGLSPKDIASCAPSGDSDERIPGVRGCPMWGSCRFDLSKFGGFKKQGPHNIGYFLQTHEGKRKEDEMSCFRFVGTMQARMDSGIEQRQKGMQGEIVQIVAQEGEMITTRVYVPDEKKVGSYRPQIMTREVSKFPRPGEISEINYEQMLGIKLRKRQDADPDLQTGPPTRFKPESEASETWEAPAEIVKTADTLQEAKRK